MSDIYTIDDLKIAELINEICKYLDLSSIISFHVAIKYHIDEKYIIRISNMEDNIYELKCRLSYLDNSDYSSGEYCYCKTSDASYNRELRSYYEKLGWQWW